MSVRALIAMVLIGLGMVTAGIAVFGMFRFRDALERIHAGAIIDTLVVLLVLTGIAVICGFTVHTAKIAILLVVLWLTNPVSSHLIARMELITGLDNDPDQLTGEGEQEL